MTSPLATNLWYSALHAPRGIWITTHHKQQLLALLYKTRKLLDDPSLLRITIRSSPRDPDHELLLVRLPPSDPPTTHLP